MLERAMESAKTEGKEVDFGLAFMHFSIFLIGGVHLVAIRMIQWDPADKVRSEAQIAYRDARTHLRALRASLERDLAD